ncbi:MAG TPA: hypothetical protein VKR22_02020 [Acidimicrobiales bacterium]|nr:hypothetical protein [Acidimicrobiales bacterium]
MSRFLHHREGADRPETGALALVLALTVCAMLTLLMTITIQVSSSSTSDSAFRLEQTQAFDAAEGGLDLVIGQVKQAGQASGVPCSLSSTTFASTPVASTATAAVTYYSSFASGIPSGKMTCTAGSGVSSTPAAAIIVATGTAGKHPQATSYAEAELQLTTQVAGTVFNDAMFSTQSLLSANNPTIYGDPPGTDNADVQTDGNINCGNSFDVQGSVAASGTFTGTNNCTVEGDMIAGGNVSLSNSTTITGSAYAGNVPCNSPASTISMFNSAIIDQSAYACGAITLKNQSSIGHTTAANESPLPSAGAVPTETLPTWTNPQTDSTAAAAWTAAGYTMKNDGASCATVYTDLTSVTSPTVITTSCALAWSSSVTLKTNVALVSTGGFAMTNNNTWQSDGTTTRLLYFIVPSPETCVAGLPGISMANNTTFTSTVNVLFYTPCTVSIANNNAGYGQIYAGQVSASNNYTQHYVPVPSPAATGGGTYTVLVASLQFEREVNSPPTLAN